ncbi:hypothetical protein D3C75_1013540 [compost metagenome]
MPFTLYPRLAQIAPQPLARCAIAFDVVIDPLALDTNQLREDIMGQALALQGKDRIEGTEIGVQVRIGWLQFPSRHQSASP